MKILRGGSAEIKPGKWFKFDIELDEQDLLAIVVKFNIDSAQLSVIDKYRILTKQAELLTTVEMERQGAVGESPASAVKADFDSIIAKLPKVG